MDAFISNLQQLPPLWIYTILFLSAVVENLVPPVPGDTVTLFGAYLVGIGYLDFSLVLLATTAGSLTGFMGLYWVGFRFGRDFLYGRNYRFFPRARMEQVDAWFVRWGLWIVLVNRFLSGARSVISIVCGMTRLPYIRVGLAALVSCLVWNALLLAAGFCLGSRWKQVVDIVEKYNYAVLAAGIVTVALIYLIRRRRAVTGNKS